MRFLITFDKEEAENSLNARHFAYNWLTENNFYFGGGYWGGGRCNWFIVGGDYSGILSTPAAYELNKATGNIANYEDDYGHEDDAQIVTEEIWERLIKPYVGKESSAVEECELMDLNSFDCLTFKDDLVGKKWIVVVNYG